MRYKYDYRRNKTLKYQDYETKSKGSEGNTINTRREKENDRKTPSRTSLLSPKCAPGIQKNLNPCRQHKISGDLKVKDLTKPTSTKQNNRTFRDAKGNVARQHGVVENREPSSSPHMQGSIYTRQGLSPHRR
jgi:hypothetical protein